ncbi:reverse transcriptase [Gossypium australe]|uniref:Reverse transcriptase n=1 Tax=Gossypium australe TaxID=47621 RepID=A0A5B6WRH1_9ROSI|nr:reverse transcriptase [Gossypium australe]
MSKAYDRVEWTFVQEVMRKMDFDPNWIDSIMKLVINSQARDIFHPTRGLRQGDPLNWHTEKGILKGLRRVEEVHKYRIYYSNCSGQQVNFDKSTTLFSSNTREEENGLVTRILGVQSSNDPERYLGLPNMVGRRKKEAF